METAKQVQEFIHECLLMHVHLRDGRPLTNLEFQLLEAHLKQLAVELAMRKSRQARAA